MSDELWKLATGYNTPDEVNAALLQQAETTKTLAGALGRVRADVRTKSADHVIAAINAALRLAGRLK